MSEKLPSYADLAHEVVQASPEPLPFREILWRVHDRRPINTRDPEATLRGALGQSRLIIATGDGHYGWKPRLINGSVMRLTLAQTDLTGEAIQFGDDLIEMLWPARFEIAKRSDEEPIKLSLPTRRVARLPLTFLGPPGRNARWGTAGAPAFWEWFRSREAQAGDHLLFRTRDGEARKYSVTFQPRAARDEAAIEVRNQELVDVAVPLLKQRAIGIMDEDLIARLLASGYYRHPVPPDPMTEWWTRKVWGPIMDAKAPPRYQWLPTPPPKPKVPEALKVEVQARADELVESVLKPQHLRPPRKNAKFNYLAGIFTKWYRCYFYFCGTYNCPGPNALSPSFETRFARLEYVGGKRFNLAFMRHTGEWVEMHQGLSLDKCLAAIKNEPFFQPW